jgi:1,2-diacylglycerol 3-beta-glucosyltransferase
MASFFWGIFTNTSWASWFVAFVVIYYVSLWIASAGRKAPELTKGLYEPFVVLLIPALNEEKVISHTLSSLLKIPYDNLLIILLNDASDDDTSSIARSLAVSSNRVVVVDRYLPDAQRGKSAVLNHGFSIVIDMLKDNSETFGGRSPDDILIGIVDADGSLDSETLEIIAPFFLDPKVGQLQIGVKIANANFNLLTRMQDMEFVGFSSLVQVARDRIGSSGLGGNGQFTRLSALMELDREPWMPTALTEDLDLGLALVGLGWETRFTNKCYVHQQGLTRWRPLLRQRTRWIQGHYQCWRHIPKLMGASKVRIAARLDLIAYLLMVITVVIVTFLLITGVSTLLGLYDFRNDFLYFVPEGIARRLVSGFLMLAPIVAFLSTYQRHSDFRLKFWELPAFGLIFTLYSYVWVIATLRAWSRMIFKKTNWVKTPRVAVS